MNGLTATIEPAAEPVGETAVALLIVNNSGTSIEVLDPDLGQPAETAGWPFSVQAYRAVLLMSYGFLTLTIRDESGQQVAQEPVSTWSTPLVRPPVSLAPGESLQVVIPLGPSFAIEPDTVYRISADYGDQVKVHADGTLRT